MSDCKGYVKVVIPSLGKEIELPVLQGADGPDVIDIRTLYSKTGLFTYDPGFMSTAACSSQITYIDGNQGILRHRGYDIADLAQKSNFLDVAYLLLYGELATSDKYQNFSNDIKKHTMVHEQLHLLCKSLPRNSHPMAIMASVVASLSAFYNDNLDVRNPAHRKLSAIRLIAKVPTLAAMAYKHSIGQPFVQPDNHLGYSANFLKMMFAVPAEEYVVNQLMAQVLDKLLVLHADHEQNASTSTVRLAGSSGANPFAVIGAGIASLWGAAHGGANEAVIVMLESIESVEHIPEFIAKVKDKGNTSRLMGFGHRVYKNYDPRANIVKDACHELLKALQIKEDSLLEIALELERIALSDAYFIERKLYPNVDFYSGIIYRILGIPVQMFTVIFAVARTVGWISQWCEMIEDPEYKIGRPRQLYTGMTSRDFIPLESR